MKTYYVIYDNKIVGYDTNRQRLEATIAISEYKDSEILETEDLIVDGVIMTPEQWEQEQAQKEQERINNLTMTSLDIIELIHSQGVDYTVIQAFLQANPMLNMQLTYCQNCYCGVVRQLCPLTIGDLTLTDELVVYAFRKKNGEGVNEVSSLDEETTPPDEKDVQPPVLPQSDTVEDTDSDIVDPQVEENLEL